MSRSTNNILCVIIHYESIKLTSACIDSVRKLITENFTIDYLVVDNNKNNRGFAGGVNIGIKQALKGSKYDFVLVLNNDVILHKKSVSYLIKRSRIKNVGILGPRIIIKKDSKSLSLSHGILDKKRFTAGHDFIENKEELREVEADFLSGTALIINRAVFEKIGLLDEQYFMYYEDVDFCMRARNEGFKCIYVPSAKIYHKESSSINIKSKAYYLARNHLLFVEKYATFGVKLREIIRLPKTIIEHLQNYDNGGRESVIGIRDFFMRRFGYRKIRC